MPGSRRMFPARGGKKMQGNRPRVSVGNGPQYAAGNGKPGVGISRDWHMRAKNKKRIISA